MPRQTRRHSEDVRSETLHGMKAERHGLPPDMDGGDPRRHDDRAPPILRAWRGRSREGTPRIVALPGGLLRHEALVTGRPVSNAYLTEIVDEIFLPFVVRPSRRGVSREGPCQRRPSRRVSGARPYGRGSGGAQRPGDSGFAVHFAPRYHRWLGGGGHQQISLA